MRGHERGFTLIELLVYSAVFSMFSLTFVYFLTTFFKVSGYQAGSGEIANQANFIVQTIERQIADASTLAVNDTGDDEIDTTPLGQPYAKLTMKTHAETTAGAGDAASPTLIYKNGTDIVMKTGNQATTTLNSASVAVTALAFTKVSTPPGKDVVLVDLTLQYQKGPSAGRISRQFVVGVRKASDAVFDAQLSPSANGTLDIGNTVSKWRSLFISQDVNIDGKTDWTVASTTASLSTTSIAFLKQGIISVTYANLGAGAVTTTVITSATVPELFGVGTNRIFLTPSSTMNDAILYLGARGQSNSIEITTKNTSAGTLSGTDDWSYLIMR